MANGAKDNADDVRVRILFYFKKSVWQSGRSALEKAASHGFLDIVECLTGKACPWFLADALFFPQNCIPKLYDPSSTGSTVPPFVPFGHTHSSVCSKGRRDSRGSPATPCAIRPLPQGQSPQSPGSARGQGKSFRFFARSKSLSLIWNKQQAQKGSKRSVRPHRSSPDMLQHRRQASWVVFSREEKPFTLFRFQIEPGFDIPSNDEWELVSLGYSLEDVRYAVAGGGQGGGARCSALQ